MDVTLKEAVVKEAALFDRTFTVKIVSRAEHSDALGQVTLTLTIPLPLPLPLSLTP